MIDCCLTPTSQHARLNVYSATSVKRQYRGRHVALLWNSSIEVDMSLLSETAVQR